MIQRAGSGKVALLPAKLREAVSQMMHDNVPYKKIVAQLGEPGTGITVKHLERWKRCGHQRWLAEQQRRGDLLARREFVFAIVKDVPIDKLQETSLRLAAAQLHELLTDFDLDSLKKLLAEKPAEYHTLITSLSRLGKAHLDYDKHRAKIEEQKRKIESEIGRARTGKTITLETIEKIEQALNLM